MDEEAKGAWTYTSVEQASCMKLDGEWIVRVVGRESEQGRRATSFYKAGNEAAGRALVEFLNATRT